MPLAALPENVVEQVARALADAATHNELTELFQRCRIEAPPYGTGPKWFRIRQGLVARQQQDHCGNNVVAFIQALMDPVRFVGNGDVFGAARDRVNTALAFVGLMLGEDGQLNRAPRATTLAEAERRAGSLRMHLEERKVHHDILRFCRPELLDENYFHAVLEATKSVADKIRTRTGLTSDGADLAQRAFGGSRPLLAINTLRTETEQSEQRGFLNLLAGVVGVFRNPTAHAPRIGWPVSEQDALDLMSLLSYLHRRLDTAVRTPYPLTP